MDTFLTLHIYEELLPKLEEVGLLSLYEDMLSPAISMFSDSEYRGCDVDIGNLKKLDKELRTKMVNLEDEILTSIKKQINISSGPQLKELFFTGDDGLRLYPLENSEKTGEPTLDETSLSKILNIIEEELKNRGEKEIKL